HERSRTPVTLYLFHLVRHLLDGRRLVCWMDEFWRLLADPAFESFAKEGPKTWRKLNGVMALATQSTSDVLESPISRTLIEQSPLSGCRPFTNGSRVRASGFTFLLSEVSHAFQGRCKFSSRRSPPVGQPRGARPIRRHRRRITCSIDAAGSNARAASADGAST